MSEMACARVLITGRVQGIGYRFFVTARAENYPIVGYVRNLETGAVEVEVEGEKQVVMDFINEIRQGPRHAQIRDFQMEWKPFKMNYDSFFVKY
jgi:acylphosphatase